MNIFDLYLDKIINLIKVLNKDGLIELPESLDGINVNVPPANFNCDISTNVSMVLSKVNKRAPIVIAEQLLDIIKKSDNEIKNIYRDLIRKNHPDVLIAQGMPQEFIDTANKKMASINAAYDLISKERSI